MSAQEEAAGPIPSAVDPALFGGAIHASLPPEFHDLSLLRPVPDHQECWFNAQNNSLLVIEIVERLPDDDDNHNSHNHNDPVEFYFRDLCQVNQIPNDQQVYRRGHCRPLSSLPSLVIPQGLPAAAVSSSSSSANVVVFFGTGWHSMPPNDPNDDRHRCRWIMVELCLIRLPTFHTDILITLSTPTTTVSTEPQPQEPPSFRLDHHPAGSSDVFQQVVSTFSIRDWTLFGEQGQAAT